MPPTLSLPRDWKQWFLNDSFFLYEGRDYKPETYETLKRAIRQAALRHHIGAAMRTPPNKKWIYVEVLSRGPDKPRLRNSRPSQSNLFDDIPRDRPRKKRARRTHSSIPKR